MAKQDFLPKDKPGYGQWHDTFKTGVTELGTELGATADEITAVGTRNTDLHGRRTNTETTRQRPDPASSPMSRSQLLNSQLMNKPILLLTLIALPLTGAEIRIPIDRQSRPVAEALARANSTPHPGKEPIQATVTLGRKVQSLGQGKSGVFQQLDIGTQMRARIELNFPEAKPGDKVAISVMDGGRIMLQDADRRVSEAKERYHLVGPDQKIRFLLETGTDNGVYRVMVRHGREIRYLEFWAGPKPIQSKRPAPGTAASMINR